MKMKNGKMWKIGWLLAICFACLIGGSTLAQGNQDGKINGFVFRDENKDGAYDPTDGDVLLSEITVFVQADSTGEVVTIETDIRGGYEFTGLALDELYTVQVNPATLPTDTLMLATAGADSVGAIAWVVFLSSEPPEPNTVVFPNEAIVSFGFEPAAPTTVVVSEIDVTAASWLSVVALFTVLGGATWFTVDERN